MTRPIPRDQGFTITMQSPDGEGDFHEDANYERAWDYVRSTLKADVDADVIVRRIAAGHEYACHLDNGLTLRISLTPTPDA